MKFCLNLIMALYPKAWRERYEDEFRAMLDQSDLSAMDWLDMVFTACETRLTYQRGTIMKDSMNRLTGMIALLSALGFVSVFFIPDEDTAEFMLMFSPMLSILLIPAMHRVLKIHRPKISALVMSVGISGIGFLVLGMILGANEVATPILMGISTFSLILIGIWLISINLLARSTKTLPPPLAIVGIVAGIAWIIVMGTTMYTSFTGIQLSSMGIFNTIYMTALFSLLAGYFLWAIGTGVYFVSGAVSRKLQLSY
ncbi:MAG: hypothetical protein Phog2KO_30900 [Phototrophicaceae bacterium]